MKNVHTMASVPHLAGLAMALAALTACGVPRASLDLAKAEAARIQGCEAADPDAVRAQLHHQAQTWPTLARLLKQREVGGLGFVDPRFVEVVEKTAAVARRQQTLMDQHADDPPKNAALLAEFERLWQQAAVYLAQ